MGEEIPSYSEVKKDMMPHFPDAERVEMASILNKPIIIKEFKKMPSTMSEGKEYVVILAMMSGKEIFFNSGEVVLKQLEEVKDKLPLKATIVREKGKRYYTLS